ncbi:hypothetical protein DYB32_005986 [Aphanomyces invadans]|nr:hypothetical protein DYB32_005986 [Aphanomyces invadans]
MTTNDHVVPTTSDYLEPDVDSNDDEDDQDEERDSEGRDRVSKKRDLHTFLMGSTRPLEYDMLPAPLSSDPTGPILPRVMPLPFLFLPPPPSSKQGPTLAKCLLPSVPKTRPPLRKYNQRTIYNCVRCGQKKKNHTCNFPENVRSVGTAMAATSAPRDTVSRYYKCGRVLVCKK